jgi:predicted DNA-binding helix-hairpin-helix protein
MFYNKNMNQTNLANFHLLTSQTEFELEELHDTPPECYSPKPKMRDVPEIFWAKKSGGGRTPLLKTLLTSACEKNCLYCPFRAGRDFRRATLQPAEMAKIFSQMTTAGLVQGLFLSSGMVGGGIRTQDKILDTAEILRTKYRYPGYIHLKLMPGAEKDQILRALQLATRVSVNLEAPNQERLKKLAPRKKFYEELWQILQWADELRQSLQNAHQNVQIPSLVTQLVVGAANETDVEILQTSADLFTRLKLSRIYYSRFSPIPDTPLENLPPADPLRPLRLYQASYLIRDYEFKTEDFFFTSSGNLPLDHDPKTLWAQAHLLHSPIELNKADFSLLVRIPGIGPKTARRILQFRRNSKIKSESELKRLGIPVNRVSPYILLNGKKILGQPSFW